MLFGILDINIVWPIMCIIFALSMLYLVAQALYQMYYIFAAPVPESHERPFESVAMLPDFKTLHEQLEDQGFIPLGLLSVKIQISSEPGFEWLYTNAESTIWVEAGQLSPEMPPMVHYHTMFEDDAEIITRFPMGDVIDTPNFHAHFATKNLDAAYHYHMEKVKEWSRSHGLPRLVMTVKDVQTYDTIYHHKHRQTDLGKFVWVHTAQAVAALIAAILMFYNANMLNNTESFSYMVPLFGGMGLMLVVYQIPGWMQKLRFRPSLALDNRKVKPKPRRAI